MLEIGIVGATGYTGLELARLIERHPDARINFAASSTYAGENYRKTHPTAPPLELVSIAAVNYGEVDVVFLCTPHTASAPLAVEALQSGAKVIDLSADFRLKDPATYQAWYKAEHPAKQLLSEAVYGLPEYARDEIQEARLIANPGCYPTAVLLSLLPLFSGGGIEGPIIVDAKSGVSGAGRKPKLATHFVEASNNFSPYNVGRLHRHIPEMEQALLAWGGSTAELIFSPHLLPVERGILATIYVPIKAGWTHGRLRSLIETRYQGEPFLELLPEGELATLAHSAHTNRCAIGTALANQTLILTSSIDNLIKGAAGQAVQNMNLMFGLEETSGLL
jgi:N-acetyl-gamma-glutamyl-phosphate reductase